MKIESAEIRLIQLQLLKPFQTSFGIEYDRKMMLLTLKGEGLEGFSEGVMMAQPLYLEETVSGALTVLKEAILPRVLGSEILNPQRMNDILSPIRGNNMAKATVEMAFWDLWARSLNLPLCHLLGGSRDAIPVGASLGIQKSIEATLEEVEKHISQGYKRVKLKIKPGWDVKMVAAVRAKFPQAHLTVDANSGYGMADIGVMRALDQFHLDYIEQPLAHDDITDHAKLQSLMETSLCLDESIRNATDTRRALEMRACRVINIKVGRVGGHLEARRVHDVAAAFGAPVWCGGMLETGIGRAHNIHLATLPNFTKPGDTSSSSRYWKRDVINEPLEAVDGMMPVPVGPGIGVTPDRAFIDQITIFREEFRK